MKLIINTLLIFVLFCSFSYAQETKQDKPLIKTSAKVRSIKTSKKAKPSKTEERKAKIEARKNRIAKSRYKNEKHVVKDEAYVLLPDFALTDYNPNGIKLYSDKIGTQLIMEFRSEASNLRYDVINAKGKSFMKKTVEKSLKETINIADLDKGAYFIRLRSDAIEDFIKFIKK